MIVAYIIRKTLEPIEINFENQELLKEASWIDLIDPSHDEEAYIERYLNLDVPTREDMVEIELSSRLYRENDIFFMTAAVVAHHDSPEPKLDPITFILTLKQLITIRYVEPKSFKIFSYQIKKLEPNRVDSLLLLVDLLDSTVDRLADALELVGRRLDEYSKNIFRPHQDSTSKLDYRSLMQQIGANGDLLTKARESLASFARIALFLMHIEDSRLDNYKQSRLITLKNDIDSLSDHASFLSTKINFLLDATLGMVGIEQNNIIKIFSVAAVIFLPPTLVASIYGMNFSFMPELSWKYGYVFAIAMILVAAWLPYKYFKYRKWL